MGESGSETPTGAVMLEKPVRLFLISRTASALAFQMLAVAVGWQIYALTGSAFYLGLVGLAQFLPMFLLTLAAGHVADHYNRRAVARLCQAVEGLCMLVLAWGSLHGSLTKDGILVLVSVLGAARAFEGPSMQALLPGLVAAEHFPRAVALSAAAFQVASIVGPALGGLLYAGGPAAVYFTAGALAAGACLFLSLIRLNRRTEPRGQAGLRSLLAGIAFIRSQPAVLGAISLDLFAVLLGGATALLPIYASKILFVGPLGLGVLRAAPAVGALFVSVYLARTPLRRRVGRIMFAAVAVFGLATIVFAVSRFFALSLAALIVLGAADVFSVVIRQSLVQMQTPDEMRGRVSAVNAMFIGTSNQLGEFESGLTAAWFGAVPAALIGGCGTLIVVALWMRLFPQLSEMDTL